MNYKERAYSLLKDWKKDDYLMGVGCLSEIGKRAVTFGHRALVIANMGHIGETVSAVIRSLELSGIEVITGKAVKGAKNNAPLDDLYRLVATILAYEPDFIVAIGGGSTLDVAKAANTVATLAKGNGIDVNPYFGTGKVSESLKKEGKKLLPLIAVETVSSSGSHLTKYSNITDMSTGQKKLIVDDAITPSLSVFDYSVTSSLPISTTLEGILDSLSHSYEVFCGAKGEKYDKAKDVFTVCVNLLFTYSERLINNPHDAEAREAIGLASDLGGYAIMIGGTSGGHLTSFSLVDSMPHGLACGIMNPYYTVFYSSAIEEQLKVFAEILSSYGYAEHSICGLSGRDLAEAVAKAMLRFNRTIGAPVKLKDVPSFNPDIHIPRALSAAKDDDLKMKLQNMPVPMTKDDVDEYMAPILNAAADGDLSIIKTM